MSVIQDLQTRKNECKRLLERYPERVPVIIKRASNCSLNVTAKSKYLVPCNITVGQFVFVLRKALTLKCDETIFIFVKPKSSNAMVLPAASTLLSQLWKENASEDGFLNITYHSENAFG